MRRRMAVIMVGDIVGYARLMETAEEQTAERLRTCQALVSGTVGLLDGRVFSTAGDAVLAEFPSAINALRCAVEVRSSLAGAEGAGDSALKMRFGLHLADVLVQGDDLVGDGVNLAARIQQTAEPDTICISGQLFEQVRRNSPYVFDDLGERHLKNISEPIRVYRVRGEMGTHRLQVAPTGTTARAERRTCSIAVMPFRVVGDDPDQRFLAEGLADELIVELGRFRQLFVSSRSATFALAESKADPSRIGDTLAVQYVLEGQIRNSAGSILMLLVLSETETSSVVWRDKVSLKYEHPLDILDQVVPKIAATVVGRVGEVSMAAARRKRPENMSAFECLLRGMAYHRLGGVTDDNAREAVKWFSRAIEADPNYGAAFAWRVCAASWLSDFDYDLGEQDIRRALELDPWDPEANRIMGVFELMKGNHQQSAVCSQRAMEMNPSDAYIKARCAGVFTFLGDASRALVLLDEADALDPFLPVWCIEERGVALYALGRYSESLEAFGRLVFQTNRSRLYRAAALVALDRLDEARKLVKEATAGQAHLTASRFLFNERYGDAEVRELLALRVEAAGLPK